MFSYQCNYEVLYGLQNRGFIKIKHVIIFSIKKNKVNLSFDSRYVSYYTTMQLQ